MKNLIIELHDWQRYQQALYSHREELRTGLISDPEAALKTFNQQLFSFAQQLWQEAEALLGPVPLANHQRLPYCVIALGSMSRSTMTAYSDVEYGLLTEQASDSEWEEIPRLADETAKARAQYLRTLIQLVEFKIHSIGETHEDKPGFQLDINSQPRTEPAVRGIPQTLARRCTSLEVDADDGLAYSLLHPCYLHGDETLFDEYKKALAAVCIIPCNRSDAAATLPKQLSPETPVPWHRYWAIAQLKRNQMQFEDQSALPDALEPIHLKKPFVKLLTFLALDLALYHNLPAHSFDEALEGLARHQFIEASFAQKLKEALCYLAHQRCQLQIQAGWQQDSVANPAPELWKKLTAIATQLLKPFYQALPTLFEHGYASFQQAWWLYQMPHQLLRTAPSACRVQVLDNALMSQAYYLDEEAVAQLFTPAGAIQTTTEPRNSAVFTQDLYCLKVLLPDESEVLKRQEALTTLIPREYLSNQLARLLDWHITPPGCGLKLTFIDVSQRSQVYYAWLCQKIEGQDLLNIERYKPHELQQLETASYSALFLLSLLIYPEDGQPRNFILQAESHRLFSIDNKRSFVNPIHQAAAFFGLRQVRTVNIKTVLYLLEHFQQPLDPIVKRGLSFIERERFKIAWKDIVEGYDRLLHQSLTGQMQTTTPVGHFLALDLPRLLLHWLPLRLQQIQRLLPHREIAADLLKVLEPDVASLHHTYRTTTDASQCLQQFYQRFKEQYRVNPQGLGFSNTTTAFIRAQSLQARDLQQHLLERCPDFFEGIRFYDLSHEEQDAILSLMRRQSFEETLNLAGCALLTNKDLEILLKHSPRLKQLDISDCPCLTEAVFTFIRRYCKGIQAIYCNGHFRLEKLVWDANLPDLETLSLRRCKALREVKVTRAPQLKYLSLLDSPFTQVVEASSYAYAFYKRGLTKGNQGRFAEAIEDFGEAIRLNPQDATASYIRGAVKLNLGCYAEAIEDFDKVIRFNPLDSSAFHKRGLAKKCLKRYTEAIKDFDEASRLNPQFARAFYDRGLAKCELERYDEAIQDFDKANQPNPQDADAFNFVKGLIRDNLGRNSEAIKDYDKAILLNPQNATAFYIRGCTKFRLKSYAEAIEDFNETIRLNPQNVTAFFFRGRAKLYLKCYAEAIENFDEVIRLNPQHVTAFQYRGDANHHLQYYAEASKDYDQALQLNPHSISFNNLGMAKHELGQYVEAIEDFDQAIQLNPQYDTAFHNRGLAKAKLERYAEAIEDYDQAIQLNPQYDTAFHNRGLTKKKLERYAEAIEDYDQAIRLNPQFAGTFNNRGLAKEELGRSYEAIEDYDEAVRLNPQFASAFYNRGFAKLHLGRYAEAIEDIDEAIRLKPENTEISRNKKQLLTLLQLRKFIAQLYLSQCLGAAYLRVCTASSRNNQLPAADDQLIEDLTTRISHLSFPREISSSAEERRVFQLNRAGAGRYFSQRGGFWAVAQRLNPTAGDNRESADNSVSNNPKPGSHD